jgi:hypothetical protein
MKAFYKESFGEQAHETHIQGALVASETLLLLWSKVKPTFVEQFQAGTSLHQLWTDRATERSGDP